MTLEEFYTALTACADQSVWCHASDEIRGRLRHGPNLALTECCPLTAVAQAQSGMPFSLHEPQMAAAEIGLTPDDAEDIVFAADGHSAYPHIRARLRACVGLPPEEGTP